MELLEILVRYEVALWNAVDRDLARSGELRLGQLCALRTIAHRGGQGRVQDLSADIGITVGAASKLVDRLERDGLVTRSPNPANRRSSWVVVTARGHQRLTASTAICRHTVDAVTAGEDVMAARATLSRLQRRLEQSLVGQEV